MIGYLAILGATLGGLGGFPAWIIIASALALVALSYAEHEPLYQRASDAGLSRIVNSTILRSGLNALVACSGAYCCGLIIAAA